VYKLAAEAIRDANRVVVFYGAGISIHLSLRKIRHGTADRICYG